MKIELSLIEIKDRKILDLLLREYQKEMIGKDMGEYKYLDSYWVSENSYPYFIKVNEEIAGFALVNNFTLIQKKGMSIAEFYVKNEFRKMGIGKQAAEKVFNLFKGEWEIRQIKDNTGGTTFWKKIIKEYTNDNFRESKFDNGNWSGNIQTFNND